MTEGEARRARRKPRGGLLNFEEPRPQTAHKKLEQRTKTTSDPRDGLVRLFLSTCYGELYRTWPRSGRMVSSSSAALRPTTCSLGPQLLWVPKSACSASTQPRRKGLGQSPGQGDDWMARPCGGMAGWPLGGLPRTETICSDFIPPRLSPPPPAPLNPP